ncbi:D-alanyl-D-alanine carboxypeptidase family protein [Amycolatopsis anabasis]|uniref:D-alanyl-D-alanine carboxypeptidase family protein n=1 Tax=Amycolatopsis anabasis TaxID=1840409 RepID=UPI00131C1DA6|nr:D-alanyl-D-alanine carboxypeptidase family protein [Amycolatopsis anabasis]
MPPQLTKRSIAGIAAALALGTLVTLGATGTVALGSEARPGQPLPVWEGIPGPDGGTVCPLDKRYADEPPNGLRPDVAEAFTRLRAAAGAQQITLCVMDGKRSEYQQQKEFDDAVRRFGTPELAAKYVLPPGKSNHVKGIAVDIQPIASAAWVERNGRALGWCRRYQNETWHFEFDPGYAAAGCPPLLPSATGS